MKEFDVFGVQVFEIYCLFVLNVDGIDETSKSFQVRDVSYGLPEGIPGMLVEVEESDGVESTIDQLVVKKGGQQPPSHQSRSHRCPTLVHELVQRSFVWL